MISDCKGYLAVKILSALLREITPKNVGGFSCLNCLHLFRTKEQTSVSSKSMWK